MEKAIRQNFEVGGIIRKSNISHHKLRKAKTLLDSEVQTIPLIPGRYGGCWSE